jgi:hypothetical protein
MNVTQLHGRVKTSIFSPPPSAAGFLGIGHLGFGLDFGSFSRAFGTPVGEHGAGRCRHNNNKNEFGGVKNLIFWPQLRALPQLPRTSSQKLCGKSKVLSQTVQRTSRPLHSNFTATSHELRCHFTRTSHELHKLHVASQSLSR